MVELQRLVAALRDQIARLKGGPGRPNLKPSGMERGTEPKPPGTSGERKRPRGSTRSKLVIDEERTVTVAAPPRGHPLKLTLDSLPRSGLHWNGSIPPVAVIAEATRPALP